MPQYFDRMTTTEVRTVVKDLEATIRTKRKAKSWNPHDWIVFAPRQVINVLKAEEGITKSGSPKVRILDDHFDVRVGAMPDVRKKFTNRFHN